MISPLLRLWLTTQVEAVKQLTIEINSSDSELLQGKIPHALVSGQNIHYQGLVISTLYLQAQSIYLNLPQMLKGEALKLLQPIVIQLQAKFDRNALTQCLQSQLVSHALGQVVVVPLNDEEIRSILLKIITLLEAEVTIDRLEINEGILYCEAQFQIKAT